MTKWRYWVRQAERGEDQSYEFSSVIVPIVLMILGIAFATLVRAAQMPVWTAASECARQAIVSADEDTGRANGERAALSALSGNVIGIANVDVNVDVAGVWGPDAPVTCHVSYDIDTSGIAFFAELTRGVVPVSAEVTLTIEPYKSRWR
jgi:hypothetical protein